MNYKYYLQSLKEYPIGLQRLETEFVIEPLDGSKEVTKELVAKDMIMMNNCCYDVHFDKELSKYTLSLFDEASTKSLILAMHPDDAKSPSILQLIDRIEQFYTLREKDFTLRYFFDALTYICDEDKYTAKFLIASTGNFKEDRKLIGIDMNNLRIANYDFIFTDDPSISLVVFDVESVKKILYLERTHYSDENFHRTMKIVDSFFAIKEGVK